MTEAALGHPVVILPAVFQAAPVLALTAVVLIAWLIVTLSDAPATLMALVTVALILRSAIQAALMFAPALSGGWQCASQ